MYNCLFMLFVLWMLGVFDRDTYDCCGGMTSYKIDLENANDAIEDHEQRLLHLEEVNGLSHTQD